MKQLVHGRFYNMRIAVGGSAQAAQRPTLHICLRWLASAKQQLEALPAKDGSKQLLLDAAFARLPEALRQAQAACSCHHIKVQDARGSRWILLFLLMSPAAFRHCSDDGISAAGMPACHSHSWPHQSSQVELCRILYST